MRYMGAGLRDACDHYRRGGGGGGGVGGGELSAEIRGSGGYHLPTCFLSFGKGEGRRRAEWFSAGSLACCGVLVCCSCPHSPPMSNPSHHWGKFLLVLRGTLCLMGLHLTGAVDP